MNFSHGETRIRLAGSGGQGMILAGLILAEAAIIHDGKNAIQTQSYGPEARGGATKSEVIISDGDIDYPKVETPDILVAMSQESVEKYIAGLRKGGLLIVDSFFVKTAPPGKYKRFDIPFTQIAAEEFKRVVVANMIALGALCGLTEVVSRPALEKAVLKRVPKQFADLNLRAVAAGLREAEKALAG